MNKFPLTDREVLDIIEDPELLDGELYSRLYTYYTTSGEMPYGTAKARTGDPDQWIFDALQERVRYIRKH